MMTRITLGVISSIFFFQGAVADAQVADTSKNRPAQVADTSKRTDLVKPQEVPAQSTPSLEDRWLTLAVALTLSGSIGIILNEKRKRADRRSGL
jgi:hypothetical protein